MCSAAFSKVQTFTPVKCVLALHFLFEKAELKRELVLFSHLECIFSVIRNQIRIFSAGEVHNFLVLASFCHCFFSFGCCSVRSCDSKEEVCEQFCCPVKICVLHAFQSRLLL